MAEQSLSPTSKLAGFIFESAIANNKIYNSTTGKIAISTRAMTRLRVKTGMTLEEIAQGMQALADGDDTVKLHDSPAVNYEYTYVTDFGTISRSVQIDIPTNYKYAGIDCANLTQLAIMVCLANATKLEQEITAEMEKIAQNNNRINTANAICEWLLTCTLSGTLNAATQIDYVKADGSDAVASYKDLMTTELGVTKYTIDGNSYNIADKNSYNYQECQAILTAMNNKVDELNSLSQENMITLQALVDKRNQAYELGSNISKLLGTGYISVSNNMR